ncbi:hypothetical protein C1637_11435 [Chryseobacterium lactis]|uniref:Uncharacterized protein n=1 Tax=Chryseobacterium lactis TaxID=1241981 RepID=A0A3G6RLL9_CHRLC|nr:hypothetical protein [Chryseobacterium lactis]AZA80849.1 hypothetical protein EG342_02505 [Chryseobacterium lactis]AZB05851.1 hypothetical protein EG341_18630 [Chryseobacterium lactis]PNW13429.1 hypothetical protein C1637_11435 [Chryseobacterium lactis]
MENKIEIQKEDLKQILFILMNKLEASSNNTFLLNKDLYWNIPDEELYDVYKEPKDLTIGSLAEDWEFLQKVLKREREVIEYDFTKISDILKLIGQTSLV